MNTHHWVVALLAFTPAVTLFDGTLGTRPDQQGWYYVTNPLTGPSATNVAQSDRTVLDTMPVRTEQAGYFSRLVRPPFPPLSHPSMPRLDADPGYHVRFDARVVSELHVSNDRAGFSVIVLSHDRRGVEIGFWPDEIWTQNDSPLFTHGEGAAFDTTANLERFDLCVAGARYVLAAAGAPILSGPLRDYSSFGAPYDIADFLFLGDDTTSASATLELGRVDADPYAAPIAVGNSLFLTRAGAAIELTFAASPDALSYRVTRDSDKTLLGTTPFLAGPTPPLRDDVSLATPTLYYFVAQAVDACGGFHE